MDTCPQCNDEIAGFYYKIENNESFPYCSRRCFNAAIDEAIKRDATHCRIHDRIVALRDDAEKRVSNIESLGSNKLTRTMEYFAARADVLNDLLMVMDSSVPCSCS